MSVKVKVHRGTDAIGGTCIEIITQQGRLILDLGMPLMDNGGGDLNTMDLQAPSIENGILSDVSGLFGDASDTPICGVILSHAHPDHFGLMKYVDDSVPIFMSGESKAMIEVGNLFYPSEMRFSSVKRCELFKQFTPFQLGCFKITPFLMDHSAFGASTLLVEVEGKRLLYSGDLRAHGRKSSTFTNLPKNVGHIDCMLMEGTTLGGKHHVGFDSEDAVEKSMSESFSRNNLTCVQAAGSNIDRLVSVYRACKRMQKTMVIDLYQYYTLVQAKAFSAGLPPHQGDHLRVFFDHRQKSKLQDAGLDYILTQAKPLQIFPGEMIQDASSMVLRLSWGFVEKIIKRLESQNHIAL